MVQGKHVKARTHCSPQWI